MCCGCPIAEFLIFLQTTRQKFNCNCCDHALHVNKLLKEYAVGTFQKLPLNKECVGYTSQTVSQATLNRLKLMKMKNNSKKIAMQDVLTTLCNLYSLMAGCPSYLLVWNPYGELMSKMMISALVSPAGLHRKTHLNEILG